MPDVSGICGIVAGLERQEPTERFGCNGFRYGLKAGVLRFLVCITRKSDSWQTGRKSSSGKLLATQASPRAMSACPPATAAAVE